MSRTKFDWEQNVHREVPNATVFPNGVEAGCKCGEVIRVDFARNRLPPVAIRQKITNHGWRLTNKTAICPTCQSKDKAMPDVAALPVPSETQTPDARKVHRAVMGWLEQAYDEDAKRYQPGFTDKSISDETGAAVEYVAKCREDYFGPLAVPNDLLDMRDEVNAIGRLIEHEEKKHSEAIQTLVKAHTEAIDGLRGRQTTLNTRLREFAQKNGWTL